MLAYPPWALFPFEAAFESDCSDRIVTCALHSFDPRPDRSVAVCRLFPVISRWKLTPCRALHQRSHLAMR